MTDNGLNFQPPFRCGIETENDQLDPMVRSTQLSLGNLLIADRVGQDKTLEVGPVIYEQIVRQRRVFIVCPASLQFQRCEQMRTKFELEFRIVDGELMSELRFKRGIHVNP